MRRQWVGLLMLAVLPLFGGAAAWALEVETDTDGPAVARAPIRVRAQCPGRFTDVLHEFEDGIHQPQFRIIDTVQAWCSFWDEVYSSRSPAPPCDTTSIDFTNEVAVVAALGDRTDTCYNERVTCVERRGDSINVVAVETVPGFSCGCGDAITQPLDVVKVSRPVVSATFSRKTAVLNCRP